MYYGFDIGGTKIALGVFDSGRQLQWEKRVPTPRDSYDAFLDAVCELVTEADKRFGCKGFCRHRYSGNAGNRRWYAVCCQCPRCQR